MKVFIAGPRALSSLDEKVKRRLLNIVNNDITIIVGDANGIDKAVQQFLYAHQYHNVIVYASGGNVRNNIGNWQVEKVEVTDKVTGFGFYAAKDIKMAGDADYGFMIWNGKSKGTLNNIINLAKVKKKVLLFFTPQKKFYLLNNFEAIQTLTLDNGSDLMELFLKTALDSINSLDKAEQMSILDENRRQINETPWGNTYD